MDEADMTDRAMAMINKAHLSNSHRRVPAAVPTGECLFCGEVVMPLSRRWCNSQCRDDWEKDYAA